MKPGNDMQISEFLLLGLSEKQELQSLIFGIFLSMFLITVCGNLLIILATISDSHMHTPMYFFLSNLSFVDICFTSTTVPKMLVNIQTQNKAITYAGYITQMFFFLLNAGVDDFLLTVMAYGLDDFLLTVMAYDWYVAICYPLHYTVIMNTWLCGQLVLALWSMSALHALLHSLMVLWLSFCPHVEISHFYCDLSKLIHIACSDTFLNDMVIYFTAVLLSGGPLSGILYSYSKIISSIRAISSSQGKYKAFSTCASHLSVVFLYYCTVLDVYLSAGATHSSYSSARASVMYNVVTPMLNLFTYSMRNKDIKRTLKRLFGGKGVTMEPGNDTQISEFLLLGLSEEPELQSLIFGLFFSMYLCGNLLIILVTISDSHLHTPMYFFLSNLSLVDICVASITVPKMLVNVYTQSKVITYAGCITQVFFFLVFVALNDFLLSVMAYVQ
ncbi:Olfactory receptor 7A17 [Tupaia chinensis]|uniref:Olfactory receptor 7A17 n=1 Tax=Tupaia chinensis TaxID=246437 RepID=L8YDK4_TUPCH|nr:Olfactory receptor 7A17 [Tupaia chinensis]